MSALNRVAVTVAVAGFVLCWLAVMAPIVPTGARGKADGAFMAAIFAGVVAWELTA